MTKRQPEPYTCKFAGKQHYLMSNGSIQELCTYQVMGPDGPVGQPVPSDRIDAKLKRLNRQAREAQKGDHHGPQ